MYLLASISTMFYHPSSTPNKYLVRSQFFNLEGIAHTFITEESGEFITLPDCSPIEVNNRTWEHQEMPKSIFCTPDILFSQFIVERHSSFPRVSLNNHGF